jgi:hypothetical protein
MMEGGVKDVLLLVPEATPLEPAPALPVKKPRRALRPSPALRLH